MRELPTGTVTLLFTDIEESTRLLQDLGRERYVEALTTHRKLLRSAFTAHGGVEVEMQGDSFLFAFASARDAVAAAANAQRALAAQAWPDEPIQVRIGLHTGEPLPVENLYAGLDVHRAARVMAAGHGGQVLISEATRDLVCQDLPSQVWLRDLGEHRLKDLTMPQRLYQLCADGLSTEFPPLRTLENRPTNLPAQATPIVGRRGELAALDALVQGGARLVTLTGPAGTGKTRLALQAAAELVERFAGGVFFVNLASLTDADYVLGEIAQTLGLRQHPGRTLAETLRHSLAERDVLLLLDNMEQVLAAAPAVGELIAGAPRLTVLVTSRAPLRLPGEREFPVPPLAFPAGAQSAAAVSQYEAVMLFLERARAVRPGFELTDATAAVVAEICARLDGLPLAIELAAARVRILPPQALLARLSDRLKLLTGGTRDLPERHRTLRSAVAWSHDLLNEDERTLFRRLSIFRGGCTLDAAEVVCARNGELDVFDALASLVEKSLVGQTEDGVGEPRFSMLETIRDYAAERLDDAEERTELERRHARFFLELAERAQPRFVTAEQLETHAQIGVEHANLLAALEALRRPGDGDELARLACSLSRWWAVHARYAEGRHILEEAAETASDPALVARALRAAANLAYNQGDLASAEQKATRALAIHEGDPRAVMSAKGVLASVATARRDIELSRSLHIELVEQARVVADRWAEGTALTNAGYAELVGGDAKAAEAQLEAALAIAEELGDVEGRLVVTENLGFAALIAERDTLAAARFHEALELAEQLDMTPSVVELLIGVATLAVRFGDASAAARLIGAAGALADQVGEIHDVLAHDIRLASEVHARKLLGPQYDHDEASGRAQGAHAAVESAKHLAAAIAEPA